MTSAFKSTVFLFALVVFGTTARAEQTTYALRFIGLELGSLGYVADEERSTYSARMRFQTSGLAGLITNLTFDARSQGGVGSDGGLRPSRYREETVRDNKREVTEIVWDGSRPNIVKEQPPQPDRLDPAKAVGSIDMMTGMHLIFRPVRPEAACNLSAVTYDGKRLMRLSLGARRRNGAGGVTCDGGFARLKGAAPQGMLDMMSGGFEVVLAQMPDGMLRVERMNMQTPLGRVSLVIQ